MSKRIVQMFLVLTMAVSLGLGSTSASKAIDLSTVASFLYEGLSYLPLNDAAGFLGAPLQWDQANGQAIMNYQGQNLTLTPNSRNAVYAGQPIELTSPPIVINGVTYIPAEVLKKYYKIPVEWDAANSQVRIKSQNGWMAYNRSNRTPWHGGPPPWAPAWGQRSHGVRHGYQDNAKRLEYSKVKANSKNDKRENGKKKGNKNH